MSNFMNSTGSKFDTNSISNLRTASKGSAQPVNGSIHLSLASPITPPMQLDLSDDDLSSFDDEKPVPIVKKESTDKTIPLASQQSSSAPSESNELRKKYEELLQYGNDNPDKLEHNIYQLRKLILLGRST